MKRVLNKEEIDLLKSDTAQLQKKITAEGWIFNNRIFEVKTLSDVTVQKTSVKNMDFIGGKITNVAFSDVVFKNCKFTEAKLNRVSFTRCTFKDCLIDASKFTDCEFRDVVFHGLETNSISYINEDNSYYRSKFYNCRYEKCTLVRESFNGFVFENTVIEVCTLNAFYTGPSNPASFAELHNFKLINCKGGGISFSEKNSNIIIKNCNGFKGISLRDSEDVTITENEVSGVSLKGNVNRININNSTINEFRILMSKPRNVYVTNCMLQTIAFNETETGENNIIKDCTVKQLSLTKSKIKDFIFENVSFDDYIEFYNTVIENMKLVNCKYLTTHGPMEHINPNKVKYINSDKFPTEGVKFVETK